MKFGNNKYSYLGSSAQLFLLISFFLSGCCIRQETKQNGFLTRSIRMQYYNSDSIIMPDYFSDTKVWYNGKYAIEMIPVIRIFDTANVQLWRSEELYYTFIDLEKRNYFRYSSFSDTAKMIQCCYTNSDSIGIEFGWNFFYFGRVTEKSNLTFLPDTILDGRQYKRAITFSNDSLGKKIPKRIYYFDFKRKDTTFTLNHYLTQQYSYSVTRIDMFDRHKILKQEFRWIEQINFIRDSITEKEKSIFNKWIKDAKQNPVKYNAAKDSIYTPPLYKPFD